MKKALKDTFIPHEQNGYKPHFFRDHWMLALSGLALGLFVLAVLARIVLPTTSYLAAVYAKALVELANANRTEESITTLRVNPVLEQAARMKAEHMAKYGYFSHVAPDGTTPWHWFGQAGYRFKYAGENLAVNFDDSVAVDRAWMASPSHRANLMSDRYTEIGIAMATGTYKGRQTVFIVQLFGTPAKARSASFAAATSTITSAFAERVADNRATGTVARGGVQPAPLVQGASTTIEGDTEESDQAEQIYLIEAETIAAEEHLMAMDPSAEADLTYLPEQRTPKQDMLVRATTNPSRTLAYAFLAIGAIVLFALIIFVAVEIRKQHPLHIAYGVAFLSALGLLFTVYRDVFYIGVEIL